MGTARLNFIERWAVKLVVKKAVRRVQAMFEKLSGKKSYLVAVAAIAYAIGGAVTNMHDWNTAIQLVFAALGLSTLRSGVAKSGPKQ